MTLWIGVGLLFLCMLLCGLLYYKFSGSLAFYHITHNYNVRCEFRLDICQLAWKAGTFVCSARCVLINH